MQTLPRDKVRTLLLASGLTPWPPSWAADPCVRSALEEANETLRRLQTAPRRPRWWTFERVLLTVSTACSVLCAAGFAWLVFWK